jgi:hypothetical protein
VDLKALEDQAKAQGGYVDKVSKTPWKSSHGVEMTEVLATVHVPSRGEFASLRQWARQRGAIEKSILDVDAEATEMVRRRKPHLSDDFLMPIVHKSVDSSPVENKYVVLLGWLED